MKRLFLFLFIVLTLPGVSQTTRNFTDSRDSQVYGAVKIGTQWWMAENLNYDTTGGFCYNGVSDSCITLGRLYLGATVMGGESFSNSVPSGVRGICPQGWHVPSLAEWTILIEFVNDSAKELKSIDGWLDGDPGLDTYKFYGYPSGCRGHDGRYNNYGYGAQYYTSSNNTTNQYYINLNHAIDIIYIDYTPQTYSFSVRCLKDDPFVFPDALYDDFETGAVSTDWDGGNSNVGGYRAVVGDAAKNGDYGLDIGLDGSQSGYGYSYMFFYYEDDLQTEIWVRYWFKLVDATLLTGFDDYDHGWHSSSFHKTLYDPDFEINLFTSDGKAYWRPYFTGTSLGDPFEIQQGRWYEVKYRIKLDGSNDTAQVWIDGNSEWFITGAYGNDANKFSETMIGYYPNGPSQVTECSIYIDNFGVYIADPGDFPSDDPVSPTEDNTKEFRYPYKNKLEYKRPRIIK